MQALVTVGQLEQAAQVATSIPDPGEQAQALIAVVQALVAAGQLEQAARIAGKAERAARRTSLNGPASASTSLKTKMTRLPVWCRRWRQLAIWSEQSGSLGGCPTPGGGPGHSPRQWRRWWRAGQLEQATQAAASISDSNERARALTVVVEALVAASQLEQATQAAASISDSNERARALAELVEALVAVGQLEQASQVAASISDSTERARALIVVSKSLMAAGQTGEAARVAADAEWVARGIADPNAQARTLIDVIRALVAAGQLEQAIRAAATSLTQASRLERLPSWWRRW